MRKMVRHGPIWLFASICALLGTDRALSQTAVWTGLAGDQNFSTPGNWQGGVVPPSTGADSAQFAQTPYNQVNLGSTAANFSGLISQNYTDIYSYSGGSLTIGSGGITVGSGNGFQISVPITLSASQTWAAGTGYINAYGSMISGTAGLTTTATSGYGGVDLSGTNTFSGGVIVASGSLDVGSSSAIGTGTLTLTNGTTLYGSYVTLPNAVTLGNNVTVQGYNYNTVQETSATVGDYTYNTYLRSTPFTLSGVVTAPNISTTLQMGYRSTIVLSGSVLGAPSPVTLTITGSSPSLPLDGGSLLVVEGSLSNVTSIGISNASLILAPVSAPTTAFPGVTSVTVGSAGTAYLGLDGSFTQAGAVSSFLSTYAPSPTAGLGYTINGSLGFDTFSFTTSPNTFNDPINLANFTSPNFQGLGSASTAVLGSAAVITPPNNIYLFGGGGGTLIVQSPLTDLNVDAPRSLDMMSTQAPVTVILQSASNTYTGGTFSNGGALIFDSPPPTAAGNITLNGGYVGYTENSGIGVAQNFVTLFNSASSLNGIIGFDSANISSPRTVSDSIDLTAFNSGSSNIYLGTATAVKLLGTITPANNSFQFTGVKGGQLNVASILTDGTSPNSVEIGLLNPMEANQSISSVMLSGNNTYSGGTTLNSGTLFVTNPGSLGTGGLTVQGYYNTTLAASGAAVTLPNDILLNGSLSLGQTSNPNVLTLNGILSGTGYLDILSNAVLDGANTYSGNIHIENSNVTLGNASALGTANVELYNSSLTEGITNPTITNLKGNYTGDTSSSVNLLPGSTLTLNTDSTYASYAAYYDGSINGDSASKVIKIGVGVQELGGTSTYGGGTTVNAGVLVAGGIASLGSGGVTVANGAELDVLNNIVLPNSLTLAPGTIVGGMGTFAPPGGVTISGGTTISPGSHYSSQYIGELSFTGNLTLGTGGIYDFNVGSVTGVAGTDYSTINVSGALTISATPANPFQITVMSLSGGAPGALSTFNPLVPYTWTLVNAGSISGDGNPLDFQVNASAFQNSLGGGSFSVSVSGDVLDLNFTPVPEPSTWVLM